MSQIGGDSTARLAEQQHASLLSARDVPMYGSHTYRAPYGAAYKDTRRTYEAHSVLRSPHSAMGGRAASVAAEPASYMREISRQEARWDPPGAWTQLFCRSARCLKP